MDNIEKDSSNNTVAQIIYRTSGSVLNGHPCQSIYIFLNFSMIFLKEPVSYWPISLVYLDSQERELEGVK